MPNHPVFDREFNALFDELIKARRTIRAFSDEVPPRGMIEEILRAGLLAPYSPNSVGDEKHFRRFIVVERGGDARRRTAELLQSSAQRASARIEREMETDPRFKERGLAFAGILSRMASSGIPGFAGFPYYIVIAEKTGVPPVELRSLSHAMENMWLKATALGLGFRLITATVDLARDREFCELLGIPFGEFGLDGCVIGYPAADPGPSVRPGAAEVTRWIK
jgi:nitroreductase